MLLVVLIILVSVLFIIPAMTRAGETFACPMCGHHFKAKWYQLILADIIALGQGKRDYLKCPQCEVRDECKMPHNR